MGVVCKADTSAGGSDSPGAAVIGMAGAEVAEVVFGSQGQRTGGLTAANGGMGSGGTGSVGSSGEQMGSGLMASSKAWAQNTGDVGSSGAQGTSDGTGRVGRAQGTDVAATGLGAQVEAANAAHRQAMGQSAQAVSGSGRQSRAWAGSRRAALAGHRVSEAVMAHGTAAKARMARPDSGMAGRLALTVEIILLRVKCR